MKILIKNSKYELFEKKSRFSARSFSVNNEKEAIEIIKKISEKYKDATHNVYAYKILENNVIKIRFSDAGEPKNTAGKPISELIERLDLINTLIIVTRYFGGIKLGASGLLRAYLGSAKQVIDISGIEEFIQKYTFEFIFNYNIVNFVDNYLKDKKHATILKKNFSEKVEYLISADMDTIEHLKSILK